MIKEFWQERREEKKRLKQQKKEQRKKPKTKEQIAYKVFGFLFVIFIIFGSLSYSCRGSCSSDPVNYDWDKIMGITDEMKAALNATYDKNSLIKNPIDSSDWVDCKAKIIASGLENVIDDDKICEESLLDESINIQSPMILTDSELSALLGAFEDDAEYSKKMQLKSLVIYDKDGQVYLESLYLMDLSIIYSETLLPKISITSTSYLDVVADQISCLSTTIRLNLIEEALNEEIVNVINDSSFFDLDFYTNKMIASNINLFAEYISANISLNGLSIKFEPKNN